MADSTTWRVLKLDVQDAPKLLVKYNFDDLGYRIQLTDLCRIWEERLSRAECVQRALDSGSSIDPSQDDEQFEILLGKIQSAFEREEGTSLHLSGIGADPQCLSMAISAPLPKPFPPFTWSISLRLLEPFHLEVDLVGPLLTEASRLQHQIEQLVGELHDKDRIISKICDRLETSGNDLTTVFPGVSNIKTSRKRGQREQLAKHVKGLADFDEAAWREHNVQKSKQATITDEEANAVLKFVFTSSAADFAKVEEGWWKALGKQAHERIPRDKYGAAGEVNDGTEGNEGTQDGEFQRQTTPPRLQRHPDTVSTNDKGRGNPDADLAFEEDYVAVSRDIVDDDSTTDDEDDLDAVPKRAAPAKAHARTQQQRQPGRNDPPQRSKQVDVVERLSEEATLPHQSSRKLGAIGGKSTQPALSSTMTEAMQDVAPADQRATKKLGAIGGRAETSTLATANSTPSEQSTPPSAKPHQMGVIGGKKHTAPSPTPTTEEGAGVERFEREESPRARAPTKQPSHPRETSQERADKKRDQLKRELEQKAHVPVKKKRKF